MGIKFQINHRFFLLYLDHPCCCSKELQVRLRVKCKQNIEKTSLILFCEVYLHHTDLNIILKNNDYWFINELSSVLYKITATLQIAFWIFMAAVLKNWVFILRLGFWKSWYVSIQYTCPSPTARQQTDSYVA